MINAAQQQVLRQVLKQMLSDVAVTALSGSTVTEVNGPPLPTRRGVVTQFSGPGR